MSSKSISLLSRKEIKVFQENIPIFFLHIVGYTLRLHFISIIYSLFI